MTHAGVLRWALVVGVAVILGGCPEPPVVYPDALPEAGNVHEPLGMPQEPTLNPADFPTSDQCVDCHPNHVAQWRTSSHAYAMVDPVFRALVMQRQQDLNGTQDQFCTQCHSAIGTRGGECVEGFTFEDLSPVVLEGVTCVACHTATTIVRPFNSGHQLDPSAGFGGPIADPMTSPFHDSRHEPMFETSEFCAGCHDVIETSGLELERPFAEWIQSPSFGEEQTCQDCHMPSSQGQAAVGGPERTVNAHTFVGVGLPLLDDFMSAEDFANKDAAVEALLATAAEIELVTPSSTAQDTQFDLLVTMRNKIDGHNLPTGTTFIRQVWLDVQVTDGEGRVLYRTGDLDDNGDLRDVWSALDPFGDPDLVTLSSRLVDELGEPTLFPWRATEHIASSLPPHHERTVTLFIPVDAQAAGPLTVEARLQFRSMPPYLLRALGLAGYVDRLKVRTIAEASATVDVN